MMLFFDMKLVFQHFFNMTSFINKLSSDTSRHLIQAETKQKTTLQYLNVSNYLI